LKESEIVDLAASFGNKAPIPLVHLEIKTSIPLLNFEIKAPIPLLHLEIKHLFRCFTSSGNKSIYSVALFGNKNINSVT